MNEVTKAPWHLWVIGGVSLLWNAGGAASYTMTKLGMLGQDGFTAPELAYFYGFPAWATAFWALGVWGCFFGSAALLLRRKAAVLLFGLSIIGLIGTTVYERVFSDMPAELQTTGHNVFAFAIWAITIALFFYARTMSAKGVLR